MSTNYLLGNSDFDLQTKIRKVSKEVFEVLLKSHNYIFQFVGKGQAKFDKFQQRISKIENNNDKLLDSVQNRFKNVTKIKQDIQDFKGFCYKGFTQTKTGINSYQEKISQINYRLQQKLPTIKTLQTQIQLIKQSLKKNHSLVQKNIIQIQQRSLIQNQDLNKKISTVSTQFNVLNTQICQTRAALQGRQQTLLTLIKDISLYRFDKSELDSKINQLFGQLQSRALRDQLFENKKYFDDKMMGYFQNINKSFQNLQTQTRTKLTSFYKQFQHSISSEIQANSQFRNNTIKDFSLTKSSFQTQMNQLLGQVRQTKSLIQSQLEMIMTKFTQRQALLSQMQINIQQHHKQFINQGQVTKKSLGDIQRLVDELRQAVRNAKEKVENFLRKENEGANRILQLQNQAANFELMFNDHINKYNKQLGEEQQWKCETLKLIDKKNEQVELKVKVQQQNSRKYFNDLQNLFSSIKDKLEYLDGLSKALQKFKQRFEEQIKQNDYINHLVTQKIEQSFNTITKLKTDFMLKVQTILKQVNKALIQVKNIEKVVITLSSFISVINQISTINLSYILNAQFQSTNQKLQLQINPKYSSLFEGFIIQLQQKLSPQFIKYRGQPISKLVLLSCGLQYFVNYHDNLRKGEVLKNYFENGKSIFKSMIPQKKYEQNNRKNTISLRNVNSKKDSSFSEFPKIASTNRGKQ